jgi:hypothetical protein
MPLSDISHFRFLVLASLSGDWASRMKSATFGHIDWVWDFST